MFAFIAMNQRINLGLQIREIKKTRQRDEHLHKRKAGIRQKILAKKIFLSMELSSS